MIEITIKEMSEVGMYFYVRLTDKQNLRKRTNLILNKDFYLDIDELVYDNIDNNNEVCVLNEENEVVLLTINSCLIHPKPKEFKDHVFKWDNELRKFISIGKTN